MFNLNNKGQSLITFVLLIPLFLMIMVLVIDVGNVYLKKQELNNVNNIAINYGLDHIKEENVEQELFSIINLNLKKVQDISIDIKDNEIKINLKQKEKGLLGNIIKIKGFNIKSTYKGKITNNKKKIERIK